MLRDLPVDLQNIVFGFAYSANAKQVREALAYLLFMRDVNVHQACIRDGVFDFSRCNEWLYDRKTKNHRGYLAPWAAARVDSPFRSFFVWWSRRDLFDTKKMRWLLEDLDFRSTRHLFQDFPLKPCRNYKARVKQYIEQHPEDAAIALSPIFRKVNNHHLNLRTSPLGRFIASDHCTKECDWRLFSIILV